MRMNVRVFLAMVFAVSLFAIVRGQDNASLRSEDLGASKKSGPSNGDNVRPKRDRVAEAVQLRRWRDTGDMMRFYKGVDAAYAQAGPDGAKAVQERLGSALRDASGALISRADAKAALGRVNEARQKAYAKRTADKKAAAAAIRKQRLQQDRSELAQQLNNQALQVMQRNALGGSPPINGGSPAGFDGGTPYSSGSSHQIGNQTNYNFSNGKSGWSQQIGNQRNYTFSDGTTGWSQKIGNQTNYSFSNGTTGWSQQIGNQTNYTFSDGTTGWSQNIGNQTNYNFTPPPHRR
jgi:hypothetical protein